MALPYPEGECFFRRSALHSETGNWFNAEDPAHFYSTMIPDGHPHKRSDYKIVWGGGNWKTSYGNWSWCPFTYGNWKYPSRRVQHELCTWGYRFKLREYGDAAETWFMFVPMPTREEQWVWMDRLTCVRAIYIPASYKSGPKYEDLCTYIHVNFTQMGDIEIEHMTVDWAQDVKKVMKKEHCSKEWGLDVDENTALGINPARLITALAIPREARKVDALSSNSLVLVDSKAIPNAPLTQEFTDQCRADWAVVVSENQGVSIKWGEADMSSPWFVEYFKNTLAFAIGYVPVIGPILSIATNVVVSAIFDDYEGFMAELREQIPPVQFNEKFVERLKADSEEAKPMLKEGVSLKEKQNEKDYVEFDPKMLEEADKAAKAKSKGKKQTNGTEVKDSIFRTLNLATLQKLAHDKQGGIMEMLKVRSAYLWWEDDQDEKENSESPELPGDSDGLADLLEQYSKFNRVWYYEGWDKPKVAVNQYGYKKEEMVKKAAEYVTIKA
ncbi:hypothetical protein BJX96DRAFT_175130 [Aspergillus floccosus]